MTPSIARLLVPIACAMVALLFAPSRVEAAACCLSTSAFGAGRLAVWEQAAVGSSLSYAHAMGFHDREGAFKSFEGYREGDARLMAFALVRLADSLEVGARFPWVLAHRGTDALSELGHGPGDLGLSLRWQAVDLGAWAGLPGVAFTLGFTAPTGRATANSEQVLGADVTGRGFGVFSGGISLERARAPWFVRLDAAGLLPLSHRVDGQVWRSGPGVELQLGGGVDVGAGLILALAPRLRWESDAYRNGARRPDSSTLELGVGPSAAWQFHPRWTVQASVDTGVPAPWLGRNRPLLTSASVGIRYGVF